MIANKILLQKKYTRIINLLSKQINLSLDEALRIFYNSKTYKLIRDGISDMHCRSDQYLVDEIILEYNNVEQN